MERVAVRKVGEREAPDLRKMDIYTRKMPGMGAWLLHRITGLGITFYLLCHIALIGTLIFMGGPNFNASLQTLMHTPFFMALDLILFAAILIHVLNGIRLLLVDLGKFILHQKQSFYIAMSVALVLFVAGALRVLT